MGKENRMRPGAAQSRYAPDKPKECMYCYFWDRKKKRCGQKQCWYLIQPENDLPEQRGYQKDDEWEESCRGCPYGRHFPCIGYCIRKIMAEMQLKKQQAAGKGDGRIAG